MSVDVRFDLDIEVTYISLDMHKFLVPSLPFKLLELQNDKVEYTSIFASPI